MIVILKKIDTIIGVIIVIALIYGSYVIYANEKSKTKPFESVDTDSIATISISNNFNHKKKSVKFNTNNKSDILEIMNYLKSVKVSKKSDGIRPDYVTPDLVIELQGKNQKNIKSVVIYYDLAAFNDSKDWYTVSTVIYSKLEDLCEKLNNK